MTLHLSEITQCIFDSDAKPLPKHRGPTFEDGEPLHPTIARADRRTERGDVQILRLLDCGRAMPAVEIAMRLRCTISGVRNHLRNLERDGLVTHTEHGGAGGIFHLYKKAGR